MISTPPPGNDRDRPSGGPSAGGVGGASGGVCVTDALCNYNHVHAKWYALSRPAADDALLAPTPQHDEIVLYTRHGEKVVRRLGGGRGDRPD